MNENDQKAVIFVGVGVSTVSCKKKHVKFCEFHFLPDQNSTTIMMAPVPLQRQSAPCLHQVGCNRPHRQELILVLFLML